MTLLSAPQAAVPVLRALAHGMIDAYLPAPGAGRDEGFHRGVSELLEEWAHDAAPALPAVRIIAQQQSARAHELRDVLARSSIPYVFHAAESADGQPSASLSGTCSTPQGHDGLRWAKTGPFGVIDLLEPNGAGFPPRPSGGCGPSAGNPPKRVLTDSSLSCANAQM